MDKKVVLADILPSILMITEFCRLVLASSSSVSPSKLNGHKRPTGSLPLIREQDYSVSDTAQLLRISTVTVHKRIRAGKIKSRKEGNRLWISGEQIAQAMRLEGDQSTQ